MTEEYLKAAQDRNCMLEDEKNRRIMLRQKILDEKDMHKNFRINMKNIKHGQARYEYKTKISSLNQEVR